MGEIHHYLDADGVAVLYSIIKEDISNAIDNYDNDVLGLLGVDDSDLIIEND